MGWVVDTVTKDSASEVAKGLQNSIDGLSDDQKEGIKITLGDRTDGTAHGAIFYQKTDAHSFSESHKKNAHLKILSIGKGHQDLFNDAALFLNGLEPDVAYSAQVQFTDNKSRNSRIYIYYWS
ncbi:hypothetical protein [Photobacterium satsumensis]|uniref:hypothetical protein n=1 Tax=Photobacterium satsumensis TaxID=2910239 RepID=UPI003D0C42B9